MQEDRQFFKMFAGRTAAFLMAVNFLFLSCMIRVAVISTGDYAAAQTEQSSYRITLSRPRGTIFDHNMVPLTNADSQTVAAVMPIPSAIVGLRSLLGPEIPETVLSNLENRKPAVCVVPNVKECEGLVYSTVYQHVSSELPAEHLIGYTDNTGHGVSGLEQAYDELLYASEPLSAVFSVNGKGKVLEGVQPTIENNFSVFSNGVITTLDVNIQNIAQTAASGIRKGAVVVQEAKTGKIRAMVSKPHFDPTDLSSSFDSTDSPLFDRTLAAYSVGSDFKPCVAIAALEEGQGNFQYTCTGSVEIAERRFNCHKRDGHGTVDLKGALAFSCNTFFYNLAIQTGAERIYKIASALGFGSQLKIGENLYTAAGRLTSMENLRYPAQVANLSIGQGDLLLSPVSMLTLYSCIANDGYYCQPTVVEGVIKNGKTMLYDTPQSTRVTSKENAAVITEYLTAVITEGTGTAAAPKKTVAAGKTATAQTGRFDEEGAEITNSWFCGFFPVDQPEYVVIVMSEGKSENSTASVFADVADGITEFENRSDRR